MKVKQLCTRRIQLYFQIYINIPKFETYYQFNILGFTPWFILFRSLQLVFLQIRRKTEKW